MTSFPPWEETTVDGFLSEETATQQGQLEGIVSVLSLWGSWGWNESHQVQQQVPLPMSHLKSPYFYSFFFSDHFLFTFFISM